VIPERQLETVALPGHMQAFIVRLPPTEALLSWRIIARKTFLKRLHVFYGFGAPANGGANSSRRVAFTIVFA